MLFSNMVQPNNDIENTLVMSTVEVISDGQEELERTNSDDKNVTGHLLSEASSFNPGGLLAHDRWSYEKTEVSTPSDTANLITQ